MSLRRILQAFVAGVLATFIFHQGGLALLHAVGATDRSAFLMTPTKPLGVPQVLSLAFWGGVWGIILAAVVAGARSGAGFYLRALLFGAIAPTLVAMFVVMPMKHTPVAGGGDLRIIAGAVILNGLWAIGTALILKVLGAQRVSVVV